MDILMLVVMFVALYFLLIRPEKKRKKEAANLQNGLKVGDVVTTIGGIVGTVAAVKEGTVIVETSEDGGRMELAKWAISNIGIHADLDEKRSKKKTEQETDSEG